MKDYSDRKACNDLIIELRDIYNKKAKVAYELIKRGYESHLVKTTEKIILEHPLDEWFKSCCYQWVEGNKAKNGVDANVFEGEPEVSAAALFFMDFVSGTRKSYLTVDSPHMPLLNIVIDCKLVSIVFGEYHRICGSMERTGIRPKAKWSYLTCAVRLGTSVEKEMSILFRDLEREQEKDDLYKIKLKGARSSKDRKKQRFVELAGYINKYHKPNVIGEIVLSYKKWYQYLCLVGGKFNKDGTIEKGTPGSDNTIMRRKTGAEKILSEKHQEEIKIIIE